MTDHIEVLRQHNKWRRGEITAGAGYKPCAIGEAIDETVAEIESLRQAVRAWVVARQAVSAAPDAGNLTPDLAAQLRCALDERRAAERRLLALVAGVAA